MDLIFLHKVFICTFQDHGGIVIAYIGLFLIAAFLGARSVYYFRLKVSAIDGPM